jgi:integrase
VSPTTIYQHARYVARFRAFLGGPRAAEGLEAVRRFLDTVPASARLQARAALKHQYPGLEWTTMTLPRYKRNEARLQATIFAAEEWTALGAAVAGRPRDAALVYVLATLRRAEAAALCWEHWDRDSGIVSIQNGKGGVSRPTLLLPRAVEALTAWHAASGHPTTGVVFPHARTGGPVTSEALGYRVCRLFRAAGLSRPWRGAHAVRRTFATAYLRENPADLLGLKKLLRHEQVETTSLYVYLEPADLAPRVARVRM